MAMDMWKADKDVMAKVEELVANFHPHLALVDSEIAIIFREKSAKAGGQAILGKSKKASPLLGVLGDVEYKFIIELAGDEWSGLTEAQRTALLDHHLCALQVEENPQTGTMKCFIAPPDFIGFRGELERHGIWRDIEDEGANPIGKLFGNEVSGEEEAF